LLSSEFKLETLTTLSFFSETACGCRGKGSGLTSIYKFYPENLHILFLSPPNETEVQPKGAY